MAIHTTANDRYSGNDHYGGQIIRKTTVVEEIELGLLTGLEETIAVEDKKSLTGFSAIAVVCCILKIDNGFTHS